MSRCVFEYYFEPDELGPHYSEFADHIDHRAGSHDKLNGVDKTEKSQPDSARLLATEINGKLTAGDVCLVRESANNHYVIESSLPQESCINIAEKQALLSEHAAQESPNSAVENVDLGVEFETQESDSELDLNRSRVREFLSVHAFGQYVFCQRAGILAAESQDTTDPDEPLPRLTFLPNFDREQIDEMLSSSLNKGLMGLLYIASLVMFLIVGIAKQNQLMVSPILILLSVSLVWEFCTVATVVRLAARRRKAIKAEAKSPDPDVTELQQVNWWSMLNAGFVPVSYQRPIRHPELPLEGCPWRVLERDSLRIPVIRAGGDRLGNRKGELFPKYHARIVAYAVLLEATNHVEVPYGLIFPHDSPHGMAVPITDDARERVLETLQDFASAINGSQQKQLHPALPENRSRCDGCAFGKPEPISINEIEKRQKSGSNLVVLHNYQGDTFECVCSNRFGTVPPHKETTKRRLVASIQ